MSLSGSTWASHAVLVDSACQPAPMGTSLLWIRNICIYPRSILFCRLNFALDLLSPWHFPYSFQFSKKVSCKNPLAFVLLPLTQMLWHLCRNKLCTKFEFFLALRMWLLNNFPVRQVRPLNDKCLLWNIQSKSCTTAKHLMIGNVFVFGLFTTDNSFIQKCIYYMLDVPAFWKLKQEDGAFRTSLSYIMSSRPAWAS
jgi:hypothetical protein